MKKITMVIILVLSMTACSSMKKNEEGKYEFNPFVLLLESDYDVTDQLRPFK